MTKELQLPGSIDGIDFDSIHSIRQLQQLDADCEQLIKKIIGVQAKTNERVESIKDVRFELKKIAKEAEQKKKEAEQNAKEERSRKRRINKEKTRSELAKKVPRRSSRIAAKKKTRCPNGTRRNKKSGNCEKKTAHTRKRCPNGTRKNKKSGKCVNTSK